MGKAALLSDSELSEMLFEVLSFCFLFWSLCEEIDFVFGDVELMEDIDKEDGEDESDEVDLRRSIFEVCLFEWHVS